MLTVGKTWKQGLQLGAVSCHIDPQQLEKKSTLVAGVLGADVRRLYCHKHYLESFLQEMCE